MRSAGLNIRVPGDKSITQRALILGAMADGTSRIEGALRGADPLATGRALARLGVEIDGLGAGEDRVVRIAGRGLRSWKGPKGTLDLENSGTGVRLLAGALAAQPLTAVLAGDESLSRRPMDRITGPLREMGASIRYLERPGVVPFQITGGDLSEIRHEGRVASAQVKSAILFAGVGAGVGVEVLEPRRSRDHSERILEGMGVDVAEREATGGWLVRMPEPPPRLSPLQMQVPGDFSSAAFFLAWAALVGCGDLFTVEAVGVNPTRTGLLPALGRMGADIRVVGRRRTGGEAVGDLVVAGDSSVLGAVEVGGDEIPGMIDEVPILAVLAARAEGVSRISGAGELRVKESDRLAALATNLRRIGVRVEEFDDGLEIEGTDAPLTGAVETFHDHRIAMAFGVLGATPGCDIRIDGPGVADVSFPGFWNLLARVRTWWETVSDGTPRRGPGTRRPTSGMREPRPRARDTQDTRMPAVAAPTGCTIVAIDGSAGSGKSTTAAAVAGQLGYRHLDSGALYRAVTLGLLDADPGMVAGTATPADLEALDIAIEWDDRAMAVRMRGARVPEGALRAARVTSEVSAVSALAVVREHLLQLQRAAAEGPGLVAEGRDMGTVVFPDAVVKIYLDAHPRERARRRILQRGESADAAEIEAEARRLEGRDARDSSRSLAPLVRAGDAVLLDTTHMDPKAQMEAVVGLVRAVEGSH